MLDICDLKSGYFLDGITLANERDIPKQLMVLRSNILALEAKNSKHTAVGRLLRVKISPPVLTE